MGRTDHFANGQFFTTGEKALIAMLAAGLFGYWAGFNLSAPAADVAMPVAAAHPVAAPPAETASARVAQSSAQDGQPLRVSVDPKDAVTQEDPH